MIDLDREIPSPAPDVPLRISEVRLRFPPDQSGSVVAYASCLINGQLVLNDIRIEHGRQGGLVIVYPSKPSSTGKRHCTFNPVTQEAGRALRGALLGRLSQLVDVADGEWSGQDARSATRPYRRLEAPDVP